MPVPDFSPGEVLTAAAMDSIGLWKISTTTFSAQTTVPFVDVFDSSFTNYRIVFDEWTATVSENHFMRVRDSGGIISTSNYVTQRLESNGATVSGVTVGGGASSTWFPTFIVQSSTSAAGASGYIDIFQPHVSGKFTRAAGKFVRTDSTTGVFTVEFSGLFNLTTVLTGFELVRNSTATLSGTVSVYGYKP